MFIQCDDDELLAEPKRYIGPQELIYAQPVSLKPVGRPIAAIPVKAAGSPVGYGPPRPVPYPSGGSSSLSSPSAVFNSGPPYGSGSSYGGPSYGGPSYGNGPPIRNRPGPVYGSNSRPPQVFESEAAESYRPKQPIVGGVVPSVALPAGGVLQQHVHHHYHHGDGVDGIKTASNVNAGFLPVGGGGPGPLYGVNEGPSSLYGQGGLNNYGSNFENYETAGSPLYKKQFNLKPPSSKFPSFIGFTSIVHDVFSSFPSHSLSPSLLTTFVFVTHFTRSIHVLFTSTGHARCH